MKRCATCAHWTPFDPKEATPEAIAWANEDDPQRERRATHYLIKRMGLCDLAGNHHGEIVPETLAIADDLSSCAGLRTAPEFGCVMHEPRSEPNIG